MNANKNETLLFASENTIFRIVSIARIVSWVILIIYLYSLIENIRQNVMPMFQQQAFPTDVLQWLGFLANLIFPLAIGTFYFLVLQGLAQALNLGLDIYFELNSEDEAVEEV
jgi:hypothetical protein